MSDEYEADVKIRRNGRMIERTVALGDTAHEALYDATNDLFRWASTHDEENAS